MRVCIAAGGRGGKGNHHFATSRHQTPRFSQPGEDPEERWLRLELKLIADVGLVGLPNAGKSTLLSRTTQARPKIADYPFTTLEPQLGIVEMEGYHRFVMADIPGLIEGAHEGIGLGDDFLRHIERTRVIVHMIDVHPIDPSHTPAEAYHVIRNELQKYSQTLAAKPELIVANKIDLSDNLEAVESLRQELGREVMAISAVTGAGLERLSQRLWSMIEDAKQREEDASRRPAGTTSYTRPEDDPFRASPDESTAIATDEPATNSEEDAS